MIGNAVGLARDPLGYLTALHRRYGPVAKLHAGPKRIVLVQSPAGVRRILWERGDAYPKPALGMQTLAPLLGEGIATLVDKGRWAEARTFILPLFSARMLKAYFEEAVSSIAEEVTRLKAVADSGRAIDVYEVMHQATFRVLVRTVFRDAFGPEEIPQLTELFNAVTGYISLRYLTLNLPVAWAIPAARRGKRALEELDARVYRLIADRRRLGREDAADMLDVLLQARLSDGMPLSDKQIRDNCMTMLFGGHETTAGTLTWAWGLLAANPAKRARMVEEVDAALGGRPPSGYDDLKRLRYTEQVFEETMRLYPMFALLFREAAEDDIIEDRSIASGDLIAFTAYTVHHDPQVWPSPERFEPERHAFEARAARHKGAYLPFSQGQRGCIGERMARMEGVLLLAILSQAFEFELAGSLPKPTVSMSIKPSHGMRMFIHNRNLDRSTSARFDQTVH